MDKLFLPLMAFGLISPLLSILAAFIFFLRHRERAQPESRVSAIGYAAAVVLFAAVGGFLGLTIGVEQACPRMGNLCGLWAAFITGPIGFSLGILLVGIGLSLITAAEAPGESNSP